MYRIREEVSSKFSEVEHKSQKLQYAGRESQSLPTWAQWLIVLAIAAVLILSVLYLIHISTAVS
jgi:hypothetical protein